jgi:hypothetical protein
VAFLVWKDYYNFYLTFWAPFAFWGGESHKIKDKETLSGSHRTGSFFTSTELHDEHVGIYNFCFWNFLFFFFQYRVELRAGKAGTLPLESCHQSFFALIILGMGPSFMPRPAWTTVLLFVLPYITGMRGMHHRTQPLGDVESWTAIFLISTSWAFRGFIAGHRTLKSLLILFIHCAWSKPHVNIWEYGESPVYIQVFTNRWFLLLVTRDLGAHRLLLASPRHVRAKSDAAFMAGPSVPRFPFFYKVKILGRVTPWDYETERSKHIKNLGQCCAHNNCYMTKFKTSLSLFLIIKPSSYRTLSTLSTPPTFLDRFGDAEQLCMRGSVCHLEDV